MYQISQTPIWRNFSWPHDGVKDQSPKSKRDRHKGTGFKDSVYDTLTGSRNKHFLSEADRLLSNLANDVSGLKLKPSRPKPANNRVLVVSGIGGVGIKGLLSQVCGGPLERIVYRNTGTDSFAELFFVFPENAKLFHTYCQKPGLFVVNGRVPPVEWANEHNSENFNAPLSKSLLNEVMFVGARRCLIFAKKVPGKVLRSDRKLFYPDPETHFTKSLNIDEIHADMSIYGEVIDICPVISRKTCFSIHFTDIRSAIMAKRECETPSTDLYKKYEGWSIWYGKDCTDRWCPV